MNIQPILRLTLLATALVAAPLLLSACVNMDDQQEPVVSTDAPPPAPLQIENVPYLDNPQTEIWRPGYWVLSGRDFAWVPGKVIPRPSPTAVWRGAHWMQHTYGWSFEQGHWE